MPYIKQNERDNIDAAFRREMRGYPHWVEKRTKVMRGLPRNRWDLVAATMTPGQLNYLITKFISAFYEYSPNYQRANDVLGVLDAAGKEFYRRKVVLYEEKKMLKNGDVY